MRFKSFLKECREKEVFKMLSIYIVSAWVLIQVLAVTWEPLGLPVKSVSVLLIALLIGFPVYIFYMWKYKLAPLEKTKNLLTKKGKPKWSKFKNMYYSSLTVIAVACAFSAALVFNNNFTGDKVMARQFPKVVGTDKIAVKEFGNNTGQAEFDIVGKMASDWITHGITQYKVGQVVTAEVVEDYNTVLKASVGPNKEVDVLSEIIKPAKTITGNYFVSDGAMIMQASVQDGNRAETLISLPSVECDTDSPLDCVEALKQRILVYFMTDDQPELNLQETPPKFESYQYLLEAKPVYEDKELYIDLINKSIEADSTFFEPQVLRVSYYYNVGEYKVADSLCKIMRRRRGINDRQLNLVKLYEAVINGFNDKSYDYSRKEYEITPFHLYTNSSTMVLALQFVNKPEDIQEIYDQVDMRSLDLTSCTHCVNRIYIKALADIQLKRFDSAISHLQETLSAVPDKTYFRDILLSAYVRSGRIQEADEFLKEIKMTSPEGWQGDILGAALEAFIVNNDSLGKAYLDKLITEKQDVREEIIAEAFYFSEQFEESENAYANLYKEDPSDEDYITRLAVSCYQNGKKERAEELLKELENLRGDFQFGSIDYHLAQYYAAIGDEGNTYSHLFKAVSAGNFYLRDTFQNDPHFIPYFDADFFKEILTYWH